MAKRSRSSSRLAERCACATIDVSCTAEHSSGRFVARTTSAPDWLVVPAYTLAPGCLSSGIDSPVSIDSSTEDAPDSTVPSTGTLAPGRTSSVSPTCTSESG